MFYYTDCNKTDQLCFMFRNIAIYFTRLTVTILITCVLFVRILLSVLVYFISHKHTKYRQ